MLKSTWTAYWRLMRFDKPIGTALLWYPVAWSLWLASDGWPSNRNFFLFFIGTLTMRAAGCVINDIADRHLDSHVERTVNRPLATGQLSLQQAFLCFVILIFIAALILVQLPPACYLIALIAVLLTCIYPLTKRWFDMPQLILGLAFTCSIPMVFVAIQGKLSLLVGLLVILNVNWVIAYDTAYAMVDKNDDILMQMRSSAILFGHSDRLAVAILQITTHCLWIPIAYIAQLNQIFLFIWLLAWGLIIYQQRLIRDRTKSGCFAAFLNNHWYGLSMWLAVIFALDHSL